MPGKGKAEGSVAVKTGTNFVSHRLWDERRTRKCSRTDRGPQKTDSVVRVSVQLTQDSSVPLVSIQHIFIGFWLALLIHWK